MNIAKLVDKAAIPVLLTTAVMLSALLLPKLSKTITDWWQRVVQRRALCVVLVAAAPIVIRLSLLPWQPEPVPHVHDEFGHLLAGSTLAEGRLANPPHVLARHFESIYVLQEPSYASTYPLGQGLSLALGQRVTGHPWAGVLLSAALMSGAITWMLFGCLPPGWAVVGGLLAGLHFSFDEHWINSYYGGSVSAAGGALVFGALVRLRRAPSIGLAIALGTGWAMVLHTRPFESVFLYVLAWGSIAFFVAHDVSRMRWLRPVIVIAVLQILAGCLTLAHDRAVTGSFIKLPYSLLQEQYGVPPGLLIQRSVAPSKQLLPEQAKLYELQQGMKDNSEKEPTRHIIDKLQQTWRSFVTPWYTIPFILLLLVRTREVAAGVSVVLMALVASALYPYFFARYFAHYACIFFFLIACGLMRLWQVSIAGAPIGPALAILFMLGGATMAVRTPPAQTAPGPRHEVLTRLLKSGGRHVVFVRYGSDHSIHDEWVYNAANIDASPVIWCRTFGDAVDDEVTRYYPGRQAWLVDVSAGGARVARYQPGASLEPMFVVVP
ncbi:MAG: hypothetical protein C5B56_15215 [Proteobacteria bacterium]|nr:MAG: hypothetical protein C5B56_15215 [Pseudomonadota bacterium]